MLSIVIVSYNTRELLRQCLVSVQRHSPDSEIIVVDNASRDESVAMVRNEFPSVRMVALDENVGFACGNNAGLPYATGEFVLLLNSDTVIEDDSLRRCVEYLEQHPDVGGLSPRLLGADERWQQPSHPFPSLANELRLACRRDVAMPKQEGETDGWLTGTALFLRRTALDEIGRTLDSGCFMYWEDCDLSARLRERGWKLVVLADAHVRHYGGASGGGTDQARRSDLDAWYIYGQARWYMHHRPAVESVALWFLQALDVVRMVGRSLLRGRKQDRVRAKTLAIALVRRLVGIAPPKPGSGRDGSVTR